MPPLGFIKRCVKALACLAVLHHLLFASLSFGNAVWAGANQLEPIDRSSPRATLNSFLINANRSWETSISSTGEAKNSLLQDLATERARSCFDLTLVPPSEREDTAQESAIMLLDIFNRIPMPNLDAVPDLKQLEETGMEAWQIPGTPIVIARVNEGEQTGQWLFAPQAVKRIPGFYELTRGLPVNPGAVIEDGYQLYSSLGGSLIPNEWVLALPAWAQQTYFKQAGWQWLSGAILMVIGVIMAAWIVRLAKLGAHPGNSGLAMFVLAPALLMILSQVCLYLLDAQLNFTGQVLSFLRLLLLLTYYLAATWLVIRGCALAARAFKRNSRFGREALDHDLVDTITFFASVVLAVLVLAKGASTLGIPLAGVITGLGVGGIAVALAAQSTLENLLGGFMLFLDRPIRVGDYCKFGDREGTVERIGLRSTKIRTLQRTIISVPNSEFSTTHIESLAARDKLLMKELLYLPMYISGSQIRQVLDGLREVLLDSDQIDSQGIRVRLVGMGPDALEVELMAYAKTNDWSEFLEIREGIYLASMRVVEQAGTSFSPPAQIQYNVELDPTNSNPGDTGDQ